MKAIIIFLAMFVCSTCGADEPVKDQICVPPKIPKRDWHPLLQEYYNDFIEDAKTYDRGVFPASTVPVMDVVDTIKSDERIIGVCVPYRAVYSQPFCKKYGKQPKFKKLMIVREALEWLEWGPRGEVYLRSLIYHEFGHCFLGKEHTNHPFDIMYPKQQWLGGTMFDDALERFFTDTEFVLEDDDD